MENLSEKNSREEFRSIENPKLAVSYNKADKNFIYKMPNGGSFSVNVPIGAITDDDINIRVGKDTWITSMTKDGVKILPEKKEYSTVSEAIASVNAERIRKAKTDGAGSYFLQLASSVKDESGITFCSSICGFRVTDSKKAVPIERLSPPYGYEISEIYSNGKAVVLRDKSMAELDTDGKIEAHFKPVIKNLPEYSSVFEKDSSAPLLIFDPPIDGDEVTEPVTYYLTEPGTEVHVFLDNVETDTGVMKLFMDGEYRLTAVDETENSSEYNFRLRQKSGLPPIFYPALIGTILIGALVVVLFEHRRMRIL